MYEHFGIKIVCILKLPNYLNHLCKTKKNIHKYKLVNIKLLKNRKRL